MKEEVRAFTIIELLTVIAIIAILAAVLFPAFASAKLAAKGAVTISNLQQIGTAEQLYTNDYDDTVVLSGSWNDSSKNDLVAIGTNTVSTWPWLLNPYMKNSAIMQDALSPLNGEVITGASDTVQELFFPQFGINYTYLSPYDPTNFVQHPIESNMVDKPAETVFGATKYAFPESKLKTNGWLYWKNMTTGGPDGSPALWTTVQPPDCVTADSDRMHFCGDTGSATGNWGESDGFVNDASQIGLTTDISGADSGGVSLRNGGGLASVLFMDSHAKKMSPQALAAGTNWSAGIQANQVVTNNPDLYLWDLN